MRLAAWLVAQTLIIVSVGEGCMHTIPVPTAGCFGPAIWGRLAQRRRRSIRQCGPDGGPRSARSRKTRLWAGKRSPDLCERRFGRKLACRRTEAPGAGNVCSWHRGRIKRPRRSWARPIAACIAVRTADRIGPSLKAVCRFISWSDPLVAMSATRSP
jgi:hypothetical protein